MSISLNDSDEILITFDELKQLDETDISLCVDKCSALNICEKSSAEPREIYNIWVHKLLKAYDLKEFSIKDWQRILEYLDKVLLEFVKNLSCNGTDSPDKQVEQWWVDTQDLLRWLETVIVNLDFYVLGLMLTFVLDVIIKTCKFANKSNFNTLCNIQQLIIHLTNNFLFKMPINESIEAECLNKVLSSLCDVGSLISSADVKMTIETWRTVAKLGDKLHNCPKTIIKTDNYDNSNEKYWQEKAILGLFKEVHEILNYYKKNSEAGSSNLLQVAQFYLKILKLIINLSKDKLNTFPAAKEFMQVYTLSQHDLCEDSKMNLCINKTLIELYELIYKDKNMKEMIIQHLKCDMDNFKSCDFILYYLKFYTENLSKYNSNGGPDVEEVIYFYNLIFAGPLLFIDCDKYPKILEYFVVLTILDTSCELHKIFCEYALDPNWIKSFASMEILNMYYGYTLNQLDNETSLKCFEYWLQIWNKLNQANECYGEHKKLTEILLKTILSNINNDKLLQNTFTKYENIEIICLKCGRENSQNIQYFQTNLNNLLKKLQEQQMKRRNYKDLLNLMDICQLKLQLINSHLKETIFITFCSIFALTTNEFLKFQDFLNKCLIYFNIQQDKQLNDQILNQLLKNQHNCSKMTTSIFLIEFLLKFKPQSNNLIQQLKISNQENKTLINLLDISNSAEQQTLDMNIFKELQITQQQSSNLSRDFLQCAKKPRIDEGNFYNIKYILNDLNLNTQKLLNFQRSAYDSKDYELLETIKNNIEKCLSK